MPGHGSAQIQLVGLGDSIPAGYQCPGCTAFPDLFGQRLEVDRRSAVAVTNLGVGGWTSADLLGSLSTGRPAAEAVHTSDVVTITIGANDFNSELDTYLGGGCGDGDDALACFEPVLPRLADTLDTILRRVGQLRAGLASRVLVTGYWNVFSDGQVAAAQYGDRFVRDSTALTLRADAAIRAAAQRAGAVYVDLFAAFKGATGQTDPTGLLADDGDHPNQAGHRQIADALFASAAGLPQLPRPAAGGS